MSSLSVCLIVKDEELVLNRCLECVKKFADEIIVVDTGSSDNTVNIAKMYTNKVYNYTWCDDFADARNYSFSFATSDYIMWIDADDVVDSDNIVRINELKKNMDADIYMCHYNVGFDGKHVTYSFYRERILRRDKGYLWHGCVHECITPSGNIKYVDIQIEHRKIKQGDSNRNIRIYQNKLKHDKLDARETYYYARELYYHHKYKSCIKWMKKFFKMQGFVENIIDGHIVVSACYAMLNQWHCAMHELYKTFDFDIPRANVCCKLGDIYQKLKLYSIAIYWYNIATKCINNDKKGGFIENECFGYYPCIQMCVCYYMLGDIDNAMHYNELAGTFKPDDEAYLHNKDYFESNEK
ncbi:MAG: glycosyltransferase family 2 protein [Clostridia bacterium]|nr:glycosyltransferase family 2 protein [Clostridia bacterium]